MPDFRTPRLFIDAALRAGGRRSTLERNQSNYLGNVLRLAAGDTVLVFNGRDGEWQASIGGRKRPDSLTIQSQTRPQDRLPRPRLRVCAAETCAARLHGAEGGRDGRLVAAAGADPLHPGLPGQQRADARQRDRGRRAMRHPEPRRGRRADDARSLSRPARGARACWCSATRPPMSPIRCTRCAANARMPAGSTS